MNSNYILSEKNIPSKQLERNHDMLKFQKNNNNIKKIEFFDRPKFNIYEKNNENNFYTYCIPQKASLGYNVLFEDDYNKKYNIQPIISNKIFNESLPSNIYHNFSINTRNSKGN